jgi:hypothetical protein
VTSKGAERTEEAGTTGQKSRGNKKGKDSHGYFFSPPEGNQESKIRRLDSFSV